MDFLVFSAVLWPFKLICLVLWLYNIFLVKYVANYGRLPDSFGHMEHIYVYGFQVLNCIAD